MISTGGGDRTILIWKHEAEKNDESDDETGYESSSSTSSNEDNNPIDLSGEIADAGEVSILQV